MADVAGDPLAPPNTYIYDGNRARQGYRMNRLAMSLIEPEKRAAFRADEAAYMAGMGLTPAERELIAARDWAGMLAAGGNIYLMYKIAGAVGIGLVEMGAQMRGESVEALKARMGGHRRDQGGR
jgi:protocatechuate 4,5-dioxygenase alpha chain